MLAERERIRVLFVDDEPNVLEGLRRSLRTLRHAWDMEFVESGREALEALAARPFHAIVSDMRMPEMDGVQLLDEVLRRHPEVIRIVLSGYSDWEIILRSVGATHHYLNKPCEPKRLRDAVDQALQLRSLLHDEPSLMPLVGQIEVLPTRPALHTEVVEALRAPEAQAAEIAAILSLDGALASQLLQAVNSPVFAPQRPVSDLAAAITFIGLDRVEALILWAGALEKLTERASAYIDMPALRHHSFLVGKLAGAIARAEETTPATVNDAFAGGLLHDIGQLVLAANLGPDYARLRTLAMREAWELRRVEELRFGTTHAELGAYVLSTWGLSKPVVEAVAFHHEPAQASGLNDELSAVTAVHVANALAQTSIPEHACALPEKPDQDYLHELGYAEHLSNWSEIAERLLPRWPA